MYGSIAWYGRNAIVVNLRCAWGWVKMNVMKNLGVLQALPNAQAYRASLRGYVQIGISERGKAGTLSVCTWWSGDYEKSVNETSSLYQAESGGMTCESVIISCGGIAASHLQNSILKKQFIKGSSKTKKGDSRLWQESNNYSNARSWGITNTISAMLKIW